MIKFLFIIIFSLTGGQGMCFAQDDQIEIGDEAELNIDNWSVKKTPDHFLDLNPLRFTNRASCAKDSKLPTESTFLMIDNMNLGRALFRVSQQVGKNSDFTKEGVYRFRYATTELIGHISKSLLKGKLPLLPLGREIQQLPKYAEVFAACEGKMGYCPGFNDYIERVWRNSQTQKRLTTVDQFGASHFFRNTKDARVSCYRLKKFSPLEGHLFINKPQKDAFVEMARTVERNEEFITECHDFTTPQDLKGSLYQIDFRELQNEEWTEKGFLFWHSLKIYLSWALRHSPEMEQLSFPYANFFKSVNFEENILFFSNGCKSIDRPECDRENLSLSSLRFLAQASNREEFANLKLLDQIPSHVTQDVLNKPKNQVNNDELEFNQYDSADKWADNFRTNLEKSRGFIKLKMSKALTQLNVINSFLTTEAIMSDLVLKKNLLVTKKMSEKEDALYRQELYYLCSEFRVAMDDKLSFLKKDLSSLSQQNSVNELTRALTKKNLNEILSFMEELAPRVISHCQELEQEKIWKDPFLADKDKLASWYQEFVRNIKNPPPMNLLGELSDIHYPILAINGFSQKPDKKNIVCLNGAHCSRKILVSVIDIYASLQYVEGLLNLAGQFKSPDLLNPYADKYTCRAYDPWAATKNAIFSFLQDMAMAVVSIYVPTPVYVSAKINPQVPVSFEQLIKDGKVYYDPKFDKKGIQLSLITDLGPLVGTPCMISLSGNRQVRPPEFWYLNGITAQACVGKDKHQLNVYGPSEMNNRGRNVTGCVSCTISLVSAADSATSFIPPTRPFYFLLKGVVGLVTNLKDPQDIPKSWDADLNSVYSSYRKFGEIKKSCVRKLRRGESCLKNACEEKIVDSFEKHFQTYVQDVEVNRGGITGIKVSGCSEFIQVKTPFLDCRTGNYPKEAFLFPETCKKRRTR